MPALELSILDVGRMDPVVREQKMSELVSEFWPVQPDPGSVADQLIKKGEERGEARGIALGEFLASANTIRILQSLLGLPESSNKELTSTILEQLQAAIEELRKQLSSRSEE